MTTKLLIEPKNNVMMETPTTMMVAQALANWNVVMDLLLEAKSVIWDHSMPTLPTNVNSPARLLNVVMVMLTQLRNVIMLHLDLLLPPAEIPANSPTVVMVLLMLSMERIVIMDSPETTISRPADARPDAPKTPVVMSEVPQLAISTEPWPVPDASMPMLVLPLDHHAVDLSNG